MVWPFVQEKEKISPKAEKQTEEELMKELPEGLGSFLKLKNHEYFTFKEKDQDPNFDEYKRSNTLNSIYLTNCADFQQAYMNCISNGPTMERMTMCQEKNKQFQSCLKFQKNVLSKLGIEETQSIQRYQDIERAGDDLGIKWVEKVEDPEKLPIEVMEDVYDKRNEIWK